AIAQQGRDAASLIVFANQTLLSHDVVRNASLIDGSGSDADERAVAAMDQATVTLANQHSRLIHGDSTLGTKPVPHEASRALLASMDSTVADLVGAAGLLGNASRQQGPIASALLVELGDRAELFRFGMDAVRLEYLARTHDRLLGLERTHLLLVAGLVGLVLVEAIFIFRPAATRITKSYEELEGEHRANAGKLHYLTEFDPLTSLPNRSLLRDRLDDALQRSRIDGGVVSVIQIDLVGFEEVNARIGHDGGDLLLKKVARRLAKTARDGDTVARVSGDEFAVIYDGEHRVAEAGEFAARAIAKLSEPFDIDGLEVSIGALAGIAVFPIDGERPEELMQGASMALNSARASGTSRYRYLTPELRERTSERHRLKDGLRTTIDSGDGLRLVYQPKVNAIDLSLVGVEALLRWDHPTLGTIPPGRFIPLAEESDLIIEIDRWVIVEASAQAGRWRDELGFAIPVSINISSRQFASDDLVDLMKKSIGDNQLESRTMEIELTEGALIEDIEGARQTLLRLRRMGVTVSIDDFGTGYSSLSYLKRFPLDTLKIDRSFIDEITHDPDDAAISRAIVNLGRSLRLSVIAEGVETMEQLDYLRELGCDAIQGFVVSRPLPPEDIAELARSDRKLAA
ncbi:MAG: bifunctional diguanylate cyclase/phosphodiesterase, partial [Acidimicrobiia bacterium]|nr:bifunctional diguanylate cyclase/phosphodiesterase [Acidimicrobiia bacterium]